MCLSITLLYCMGVAIIEGLGGGSTWCWSGVDKEVTRATTRMLFTSRLGMRITVSHSTGPVPYDPCISAAYLSDDLLVSTRNLFRLGTAQSHPRVRHRECLPPGRLHQSYMGVPGNMAWTAARYRRSWWLLGLGFALLTPSSHQREDDEYTQL